MKDGTLHTDVKHTKDSLKKTNTAKNFCQNKS